MWPFRRPEARSAPGGADYADTLTALLLAQADGTTFPAEAGATAAVEAASGLIARGLARARVSPPGGRTAALTPSVLHTAGRELARRGEALFRLSVAQGRVYAAPVSHWDVRGSNPDPASWRYRADQAAPDFTGTEDLDAGEVLHLTWAVDARAPWRGVGPLQAAVATARLQGRLEGGIGDEAAVPSGAVIPMPGSTDQREQLETQHFGPGGAKGVRGMLRVVAAGVGSWSSAQAAQSSTPPSLWQARRIGPDTPAALVELRREVAISVYAALGVPAEFLRSGEGTASREAWDRLIAATLEPLGLRIAEEATAKLGAGPVSFDFSPLLGRPERARTYATLRRAEMDGGEAARFAGIGT